MVQYAQSLMLATVVLLVPVSFMLWIMAIDRVLQERPILNAERRRPVPWTLIDMLIVALAGLSILLTSQLFNKWRLKLPDGEFRLRDLTPDQQVGLLQSFCVSGLTVLLIGVLIIRFRPPSTWVDMGIRWDKVNSDLRLGLSAFIMLFFPMTAIHIAASFVFPTEEKHPFIEVIIEDPQMRFLIPIAFAAVIVAPLAEEFFFRVMLQGWLERFIATKEWTQRFGALPDDSRSPTDTKAIDAPDLPAGVGDDEQVQASSDGPSESLGPADEPVQDPHATDGANWLALPENVGLRWIPIVATSLLFAMAHRGQGPAPIPLFFLALGLGYLYQRTHRWLPCVVVHFLVNLSAVLQMGLQMISADRG